MMGKGLLFHPNAVKLLTTGVTCHVSKTFQERNVSISSSLNFYAKRAQKDYEASRPPHAIVPDCTLCELMISPVFLLLGPCFGTPRLDD